LEVPALVIDYKKRRGLKDNHRHPGKEKK